MKTISIAMLSVAILTGCERQENTTNEKEQPSASQPAPTPPSVSRHETGPSAEQPSKGSVIRLKESVILVQPRGFPQIPSTYTHDDWKYTISYRQSDPNSTGRYVLKLSYKGKELRGKHYDRVTTPWGSTLRFFDDGWIDTRWISLTLREFTKGRDITPETAVPLRACTRPSTNDTVSDCLAALKSDNSWIRRSALNILARMGPDSKRAVPALIGLLEKSRPGAVGPALIIETIGRIGQEARDAMPMLLTFREHKDPNVRSALVGALLRVDPKNPETEKYLRKASGDSEQRVQRAAKSALKELQKMRERKR